MTYGTGVLKILSNFLKAGSNHINPLLEDIGKYSPSSCPYPSSWCLPMSVGLFCMPPKRAIQVCHGWRGTWQREATTYDVGGIREITNAIATATKQLLATGTRGGLHRVIFVSIGLLFHEVLEAYDRKCCRNGLPKPPTGKAGIRGGLHRVIFVSVGLLFHEVLEAYDRKCCRNGLLKPPTRKAKKWGTR